MVVNGSGKGTFQLTIIAAKHNKNVLLYKVIISKLGTIVLSWHYSKTITL